MFCPSCGTKLDDGSKFCGSCGARIESSEGAGPAAVLASIALASLPPGLANCPVTITQVTAEGPDHEGGLRVEFKYEISNPTDEDWEYVTTRAQILSASGQVMEETRDMHEQTFAAGESVELEGNLGRIKAKALGPHPEQAHLVIDAVACGLHQQKLGQVDIPETPFEMVALKPVKLGNILQLVSGSLWKTEPDSDKDVLVEVRGLIQNLTRHSLPEVKILVEITDKSGRELPVPSRSDEVRPADSCLISGSGYCKDKKLKGAKADLTLRVYSPLAAGVGQSSGMDITASEASADDDDPSDDDEQEEEIEMTKRTGKTESGKTRKAKFTFSHQRNFELDQAGFDTVCSVFGFASTEGFERLIPKNGTRDTATEKEYRAIDKKILPHLGFNVFFENFAKPELLFKEHERISWDAENSDPRVKSSRITYLALWDSDSEDNLKRLEIGVEAEIIMNVIDGVDVENACDWEDTDIGAQFRECRNMFNFWIKDFEYDDDEDFDHDWAATFCN